MSADASYDSTNIKVLKGLMLFENGQECILVIPMMALVCIIWFLKWWIIPLMKP